MKKAFAIIGIVICLLAAAAAGAVLWMVRPHFGESNCGNMQTFAVIDGQDTDAIRGHGYTINLPDFENIEFHKGSFGGRHTAMDEYYEYAWEIAERYGNYAKLDYTVTKKGSLLTIEFYGYGYPDNGEGEPEPLGRTFIYDTKGATPDNPPKLVSEAE